MYDVSIKVEIKKGGEEFASLNLSYANMDYKNVTVVENEVMKAINNLHEIGVKKAVG
jgi:hypothetical protein